MAARKAKRRLIGTTAAVRALTTDLLVVALLRPQKGKGARLGAIADQLREELEHTGPVEFGPVRLTAS